MLKFIAFLGYWAVLAGAIGALTTWYSVPQWPAIGIVAAVALTTFVYTIVLEGSS